MEALPLSGPYRGRGPFKSEGRNGSTLSGHYASRSGRRGKGYMLHTLGREIVRSDRCPPIRASVAAVSDAESSSRRTQMHAVLKSACLYIVARRCEKQPLVKAVSASSLQGGMPVAQAMQQPPREASFDTTRARALRSR